MRGWEDVKRRRCEGVKMRKWEDVKMRRCEDEKMRRCEDVKMGRCEDVRWEDEKMWRWEDAKMFEDVYNRPPTIRRTLRSNALGKKRFHWLPRGLPGSRISPAQPSTMLWLSFEPLVGPDQQTPSTILPPLWKQSLNTFTICVMVCPSM